MPDFTAIKARQQQTWATGDYAMIGHNVVLASELLCHAVDLRAGGRPSLVRRHRHRLCPGSVGARARTAAAERLPVTFHEGDAEYLPVPDGAFDVVLSTFGVMFASDQAQAARELLRVCRPGGKIKLANWTPDSLGAGLPHDGGVCAPSTGCAPPTVGGPRRGYTPSLAGVTSLHCMRRSVTFRYRSAHHIWSTFGCTLVP